MAKKRLITVRLTRDEAKGLFEAGCAGMEALNAEDTDESTQKAACADAALKKLGTSMTLADLDG